MILTVMLMWAFMIVLIAFSFMVGGSILPSDGGGGYFFYRVLSSSVLVESMVFAFVFGFALLIFMCFRPVRSI